MCLFLFVCERSVQLFYFLVWFCCVLFCCFSAYNKALIYFHHKKDSNDRFLHFQRPTRLTSLFLSCAKIFVCVCVGKPTTNSLHNTKHHMNHQTPLCVYFVVVVFLSSVFAVSS